MDFSDQKQALNSISARTQDLQRFHQSLTNINNRMICLALSMLDSTPEQEAIFEDIAEQIGEDTKYVGDKLHQLKRETINIVSQLADIVAARGDEKDEV